MCVSASQSVCQSVCICNISAHVFVTFQHMFFDISAYVFVTFQHMYLLHLQQMEFSHFSTWFFDISAHMEFSHFRTCILTFQHMQFHISAHGSVVHDGKAYVYMKLVVFNHKGAQELCQKHGMTLVQFKNQRKVSSHLTNFWKHQT